MTQYSIYQGDNYIVLATDLLLTYTNEKESVDFLVEKIRINEFGDAYIFIFGEIDEASVVEIHNSSLDNLLKKNFRSLKSNQDFKDLFVVDPSVSQLYLLSDSGYLSKVPVGVTNLTQNIVDLNLNDNDELNKHIKLGNKLKIAELFIARITEVNKVQGSKGYGVYIFEAGNFKTYAVSDLSNQLALRQYIQAQPERYVPALNIMLNIK